MNRKLAAELIGTFCLIFFAVGSAVFGFNELGAVGVGLTFGLVLLSLAYAIGPISGCHVNPAVTLGVLIARRIEPVEAGLYVVAQIVGASLAGLLLKLMVGGKVIDQTQHLGTNDWGAHIGLGGAFVLEIVLTFLLVFVVLLVTGPGATPGFGGLAIGIALAVANLVGIPLDGASVNPARSLGPAWFAGSHALGHVWLFIVAPLVGAVVAAGIWMVVKPDSTISATETRR
jgi:aquaporin Z